MALSESITQRIERIAQREGRTPESLLQTLLDEYEQRQPQPTTASGEC